MANDKDYEVIETNETSETRRGSGTVETFDGKTLDTPISYTFDYTVFKTLAAAKVSEDWPSESAVWKQMGIDAERSAKATAYQSATAKLRAAKMETPEYKFEQLVKNIRTMRPELTQAQAESLASNIQKAQL